MVMDHVKEKIAKLAPNQLLMMAYQAALKSIDRAIVAIEEDDIEARYKAIAVTTDIISELYLSLDRKRDEQNVENIAIIYSFILKNMSRVHTQSDIHILRHCRRLLAHLYDNCADQPDGAKKSPSVHGVPAGA